MAHVETYLPVGSCVTVSRSNGPINYTTTKEVVVTESNPETCPLSLSTRTYSGNWLRDRKTTVQGVTLWYAARSLRRRIVVPETDTTSDVYSHPLSKIDYDIPTALGTAYAYRVAGEFAKIAVKCSKSTWVLRTGDIPYNLLATLEEDGCTVNCDPIDPSATKKLIARAIIALQEQVETYVTGANETLQSAIERLNASEGEDQNMTEQEAIDKCLSEAKALEKRLEKYKASMTPGAARLGIHTTAWNPDRLTSAARINATNMRARAAAYKRGTQALTAFTDTTAKALAHAAANNALPVEVMGDALREADEEKLADELNEVFSLIGTGTED